MADPIDTLSAETAGMADVGPDAPTALPAPEIVVPEEIDQQRQAREARETVGRLPRQRAEPKPPTAAPTSPQTPVEVANPYERFVNGPHDDGSDMLERTRLNMVNSYYRGTAAGSAGLSAMAHIYEQPDAPEMEPGMKEARANARKEYEKIVEDLMVYDMMPSWSGLPQLGVAIGGTVAGALPSPESFLGWASKGATWAARTINAAIQQGLISGATDPAIQALNMGAGVQKEWDFLQSGASFLFGAALGGGFHAAGEGVGHLIGQRELRKQLFDLSQLDNDLTGADYAIWALDPRNGITLAPPREAMVAATEPPPRPLTPAKQEKADAAVFDARRKVFLKEVPPEQFGDFVREFVPNDPIQAIDLPNFYERREGETADVAFGRAVDEWADSRPREQLEVLTTDEELNANLRTLQEAMEQDAARPSAGFWFEGTGVGLYIAKNIILLSGGKIGFTSQKNKGSTFWFTLPIKM